MGSRLDRRRSTKKARSTGTSTGSRRPVEATNRIATYLSTILRLLQLVAAVVAIGYYASAIHKPGDKRPVKYSNTQWIYSLVVMCMAALTALVLLILALLVGSLVSSFVFVWEWILVILLSAVTGVMCHKYFVHHKPEHATEWHSMRVAAGFVCASLALWFISAVAGSIKSLPGLNFKGGGRSAKV